MAYLPLKFSLWHQSPQVSKDMEKQEKLSIFDEPKQLQGLGAGVSRQKLKTGMLSTGRVKTMGELGQDA